MAGGSVPEGDLTSVPNAGGNKRYSVQGSRAQVVAEAREFGIIGLLSTGAGSGQVGMGRGGGGVQPGLGSIGGQGFGAGHGRPNGARYPIRRGDSSGSYAAWRDAPNALNQERYASQPENPFLMVTDQARSTFSIDVDTASYANGRRFLTQGSLPPPESVRVEEWLNYFSYSNAGPTDGSPFAVHTEIATCPWNGAHRLVRIALTARPLALSATPPRNLVFLVDVSGSMQEENKLPLLKRSLGALARTLRSEDKLAIVVYAGASGVVLPPTSGAEQQRIARSLSVLQAGGSTNGAAGIELAYQLARQQYQKNGVNRVILATDGDFNVGVTSEGALVRLIEEKRKTGVFLTVLGFGDGNLNDSTMEMLADKGNGAYAYIDSLAEGRKVLVSQAGSTLVTIAKDVKLQVEFNPRVVAAYRLIGYENRLLQDRDFNDDKKDAGDMGAGHSVTALYELILAGETLDIPGIDALKYQQTPSRTATPDELMNVKVRYKGPDADNSVLTSVAVSTRAAASPELGFASAVAEFGMLLRESEHRGAASFSDVRALATRFKGADPYGHRAEFIRLIDEADAVSQLRSSAK